MNYIKYQLSNGTWVTVYAPDHRNNPHPMRDYCIRGRGDDQFAYLIQDINAYFDNFIPFEGYQIIKIEEKSGPGNEINFKEISIY
jgi:hypothetical protein